jgi:anti-sigma B factor antagonist
MDIKVDNHGQVCVVAVSGAVDALTATDLAKAFEEQVGAGRVSLVADLNGVEYTSSAGLRALLATVKLARQGGGDFRLAGVQPNVRKVLELSGFTSILKLYPDVAGAVASFAGSASTTG